MPQPIDLIIKYLSKTGETVTCISNETIPENFYIVALGDFITFFLITLDQYLQLKLEFPNLTATIHGKLLKINYTGKCVVKYSYKYNCGISPFEFQNIWPDAFEDYNEFANHGNHALFIDRLYTHHAVKLNVTRANDRNKSCELTLNDIKNKTLNYCTFTYSGGSHSAILKDTAAQDIIKVSSKCIDSFDYNSMFDKIKTEYLSLNHDKFMAPEDKKIKKIYKLLKNKTHADEKQLFRSFISFILLSNTHSYQYSIDKINNLSTLVDIPDKLEYTLGDYIINIVDYNKIIKNKKKKKIFKTEIDSVEYFRHLFKITNAIYNKRCGHLTLYTAFGDINGGTTEDGVILDKDVVDLLPRRLNSTSCWIKIFQKKNQTLITAKMEIVYEPRNQLIDGQIIFGYLHSKAQLDFTQNENIKIKTSKIKDLYIYTIYCNNFLNPDINILVQSFISRPFIFVNFQYISKIEVGTKIANYHGQKNIICKTEDLSPFSGVNIKGETIKPSILYPLQSLVSRSASGQYLEYIESENLCVTKDGACFGTTPILIHHIEPNSKLQNMRNGKIDLYTYQNGFVANNLNGNRVVLTNEAPINRSQGNKNAKEQLILHQIKGNCITLQ